MMKIGDRIKVGEDRATIRYIGAVGDTDGEWLGVEWDDASRGKHNGTHNGKTYFSCKSPSGTAGSFVRERKIEKGVPFLSVVRERYEEASVEEDLDMRDAKNQLISVELVGARKVESKISKLDALLEAVLDNTLVSSAGEKGAIAATTPLLLSVDLTATLVSSWETVVAIAEQLPSLKRLYLSKNVLVQLEKPLEVPCFARLEKLFLSNMDFDWRQVACIAASMPALVELHICENKISTLGWVSENG